LYSASENFSESGRNLPQTEYEYTKYCNELDAFLYYKRYNMCNNLGMRFFSIYGYNELHKGKYANLVSQFLWAMEKGERPILYGDGEQSRDFVWIEDLCKVIEMLMSHCRTDIVNIGSGKSVSLNELVQTINDVLGTNIEPVYIDNPIKDYIQNTKADTEKLKWIIDYVPNTSLHEGIEKLVKRKTLNSRADL